MFNFLQAAFFSLVLLFDSAFESIRPDPQTINLAVTVTPDYKVQIEEPVYKALLPKLVPTVHAELKPKEKSVDIVPPTTPETPKITPQPTERVNPTLPTATVEIEPKKVPTTLAILNKSKLADTPYSGGNCSTVTFKAELKDQFDSPIDGEISFTNPDSKEIYIEKSPATFTYKPQSSNVKQKARFTSNNLIEEVEVTISKSAYESAIVGRTHDEAVAYRALDGIKIGTDGKCL